MPKLYLVIAIFALSLPLPAADKSGGWLPVTQQEREMKSVPGYPGAPAVQLYLDYYKDDNEHFISVYRRIKILTSAGLDPITGYGNPKITVRPGESLKSLAARTIQPDGSVVEFSGKPFDTVIVKAKGIKVSAKSFAFPLAGVGSILEFRYTINLPRGYVQRISSLPVQEDLYTVRAHFRFRAFQGLALTPSEWSNVVRQSHVSYAYFNQVDATVPQKKRGELMEMELKDIPPFQADDYMPPEADFKPHLLFYYGEGEARQPEQFWQQVNYGFNEWVEKSVGDRDKVRETAEQVAGAESNPEQKLRKLYSWVQKLRNTSYERERTEQEEKREGIKQSYDVSDAIKRGYGTEGQLNRLFLALVRAAGFDAHLLLVSGRDDFSFVKNLMVEDQLSASAVLVTANGKDYVLEPGVIFCPFGYLRWMNTGTTALRITKGKVADFVTTPAPPMSVSRRVARVTLAADGSLKGEIALELGGEDALEHRLEARISGDAGKRESLEGEIKAMLPSGAILKLIDSEGWETSEGPLKARFSVEIPSFASVTGKRILTPALLFSTIKSGVFNNVVRRYPVVFSYPFTEEDEVRITLPEGYTMDTLPYRRKSSLPYAGYEVSSTQEGNDLITRRKLHVDAISLPAEKYFELQDFFPIVLKGDGGGAVLQKAQAQAQP